MKKLVKMAGGENKGVDPNRKFKQYPETLITDEELSTEREKSDYYLINNRFYLGTYRKFTNARELAFEMMKYFKSVDDNPQIELKVFGTGITKQIPHPVPYSVNGMCLSIGLKTDDLKRYENFDIRPECTQEEMEMSVVVKQAKEIIRTQKMEGAYTGMFSHQLFIAEYGLIKKSQKVNLNINTELTSEEVKGLNESLEGEY